MVLRYRHTNFRHFYVDEYDRYQGEFKEFFGTGELGYHCYYVDHRVHGEYRTYNKYGKLLEHSIYINGYLEADIDPNELTDEDKAFLILQHGIKFLP